MSTIPIDVTLKRLSDSRLFRGLSEAALEKLARELHTRSVHPGAQVVTEGELARDMFVVLDGELEVLKTSGDGDVRLALLGPGDWFGEMAILDVQPRSASVRAVSPSALLSLTAEDVERLLAEPDARQHAVLLRNIALELSRRLRVADGLIATARQLAQEYVQKRRT